MKLMSIIPGKTRMEYALLDAVTGKIRLMGVKPSEPGASRDDEEICARLFAVRAETARIPGGDQARMVAVRLPHGAGLSSDPVIYDDDVRGRLEANLHCCPILLPQAIHLLDACRRVFVEASIWVISETAIFAGAPRAEGAHGIEPEFCNDTVPDRAGFHGLFHEAAYRWAVAGRDGNAMSGSRVISICLDDTPEIAAIRDGVPVTFTGGVTPLEGLPGLTTSGDVDPGVLLSLARSEDWGPEQINDFLTRECGIQGLSERFLFLPDLFGTGSCPEVKLAREVIRYRMLLSCGMCKAVMGGVDCLVFSGPYWQLAEELGPWLAYRLQSRSSCHSFAPPWYSLKENLHQVIADRIRQAAGGTRQLQCAEC